MTQQEEEHDPLVHDLQRLSDQLMVLPPDTVPDPASFLSPFLEVIRQEHTSGHTTGIALSSINKFLSYGIISACVCSMYLMCSVSIHYTQFTYVIYHTFVKYMTWI